MSANKKQQQPSGSNGGAAGTKKDGKEDGPSTTTTTTKKNAPIPPPPLTIEQRLQDVFVTLKKAAEQRDATLVLRALRKTTIIRYTATLAELRNAVKTHMTPGPAMEELDNLLATQPESASITATATNTTAMEIDGDATKPTLPTPEPSLPPTVDIVDATTTTTTPSPKPVPIPHLPEIDMYLHLLCLRVLWKLSSKVLVQNDLFLKCLKTLMASTISQASFKSCEVLVAGIWSLYSLVSERANVDIRNELLAAHRSACLRLDEVVQATLTNLILRDFVRHDQIASATKFANKVRFPDHISNNQHARHLYYLGRIEALQLEYGKALSYLQQSIRKTSSSGRYGLGFRIEVHKLCTVVLLLTGEMPDRQWFSDPEMSLALKPYFELCKAVRSGSVAEFEACRDRHRDVFLKDKTFTLCHRLHSSVIKTGLRAINAAFSKISFADVARKLDLGVDAAAAEAAEYLCAKAIRDGVLTAYIDGDNGCLIYSESVDLYSSTSEPAHAFNRRVNFLLDAHNEAVKAMRFPPEAYRSLTKQLNDDTDDVEDLEDLDEEELDGLDE